MPEPVVLSVRGEARRTVAPDAAVLHGQLSAFAPSKAEALALIRAAQDVLVAALSALGGVPLTADAERNPLTWSVTSVATHDERVYDPDAAAGRIFASAHLTVTVRDLSQLDDVAHALGRQSALELHGASWLVDSDNPAWPAVRAAAIDAAIAKGHDYAVALGGTLQRVLQVADAGLLGSDDAIGGYEVTAAALASGGHSALPTLDPVPQEVRAVIEARLTADVPALA